MNHEQSVEKKKTLIKKESQERKFQFQLNIIIFYVCGVLTFTSEICLGSIKV